MKKLFLLAIFALIFSGCTQSLYNWNGYDDAMYQYYKNPMEREKFIEKLQTIIVSGEETNKVPPGICAEYGYLQYENGNYQEAIKYFQKEYDRWPESRTFTSKMLRNAKLALERENSKKVKETDAPSSIEKTNLQEHL